MTERYSNCRRRYRLHLFKGTIGKRFPAVNGDNLHRRIKVLVACSRQWLQTFLKVPCTMSFPKYFVWGVATSAYQIEGAATEDGRGASIWDEFCTKPGAVLGAASAASACDHYHRSIEDINLMRRFSIPAYRFSISWPRVLPEGTGAVNTRGLDFYDRLVDSLLAAGLEPWVTLFHWDYPLALHHRGGWLHPDSPAWFADYVRIVADRLSDRVENWFTLNEPQIFVGCGYQQGTHAPGEQLAFDHVLAISHNVLRSHGMAVMTLRSRAKKKPLIGYALAPNPVPVPATPTTDDISAARRLLFSITRKDCMNTTWWTDPVLLGEYPEDGLQLFGKDVPAGAGGDLDLIAQPLDFIGLNIYFGIRCFADIEGAPHTVEPVPADARTGFGWQVMPESIYWGVKFFAERYHLPIVISENGAAYPDVVSPDGCVHDRMRIEFLRAYLHELKRACDEGIAVHGYFLWSLLDNFEWAAGYTQRFGIVYVDFGTGKRTPKDSAWWYHHQITTNGADLSGPVLPEKVS